jgi:hypothetical protein
MEHNPHNSKSTPPVVGVVVVVHGLQGRAELNGQTGTLLSNLQLLPSCTSMDQSPEEVRIELCILTIQSPSINLYRLVICCFFRPTGARCVEFGSRRGHSGTGPRLDSSTSAQSSRLESLVSVRSGHVVCPWLTIYLETVPLVASTPADDEFSVVFQTYPWSKDRVLIFLSASL